MLGSHLFRVVGTLVFRVWGFTIQGLPSTGGVQGCKSSRVQGLGFRV